MTLVGGIVRPLSGGEDMGPSPVATYVVRTKLSLETRPSPSSTRACSVSYNYAWEYFRRQKAGYILSRDACRDYVE